MRAMQGGMPSGSPFSVGSLARKGLTFTGVAKTFPVSEKDAEEIRAFSENIRRILKTRPRVSKKAVPRNRDTGRSRGIGFVKMAGAPKTLACPKCSRRFAHRLHLDRHLSATHGTKKRAISQKR